MQPATRNTLSAGRQHWRHGPIDLVIEAWGDAGCVEQAYACAWERFAAILPELVGELAQLRRPVSSQGVLTGPVARRMLAACAPYLPAFITPMAAVAGSVADEIVAFFATDGVRRAYVNNGGDIAVHLAAGQSLRVGLVPDLDAPSVDGSVLVQAASQVRGVATSGWRGRSFSLGIADSVTVLAGSAAQADAAATIIANAVNLEHPAIRRAPACSLKDDTDLGERLVTVAVGNLPGPLVESALGRGAQAAQACQQRGLILGAALALQGRWRTIGPAFAALAHTQDSAAQAA